MTNDDEAQAALAALGLDGVAQIFNSAIEIDTYADGFTWNGPRFILELIQRAEARGAARQAEEDAQICDDLAAERRRMMDDPRNADVREYFLDMKSAYSYAARAIRALALRRGAGGV